jgi:hypothetical protein
MVYLLANSFQNKYNPNLSPALKINMANTDTSNFLIAEAQLVLDEVCFSLIIYQGPPSEM